MSNGIKNLKVGLKLYILVGTALALMLALVIAGVMLMGNINKSTDIIAVKWMPSCTLSNEMDTSLSNLRRYKLTVVTGRTDEEVNTNIDKVEAEIAKLDGYISDYGDYVSTTEGRRLYETLQTAWNAYKQVDTRIMDLAKAGQLEDAEVLLKGDEGTRVYNDLSASFNNLSDFNTKGSEDAHVDSTRTYKTALVVLVAMLGVAAVIGVSLSMVIIRSIRIPVAELEKAAIQMAQGNLDVDIVYESKDELGVLAAQFREVVRKLSAIVNDEKQFMAKMAAGDLTVDSICPQEYIGTFDAILKSFRTIAGQMNDAMTKISESSEQVSNSADQVSSGAQALSQGATEQASSIEELAATINDISDRIKENAENAKVANTKVEAVGENMNLSNAKMQDMIQAMSDINNSSNEIGKIIKTIEDIAFQTNILALNAAVEAARAGSAGKGFAVVADEVRNLASKSAEASKNTAALIENSNKAVQNGTEIASETAKTLVQAVEGVKEATRLVDKISEASSTQSAAISQITLGIDQISSVIQTNSATAEESAAASQELSSQAQLMREQVNKFQLKATSGSSFSSSVPVSAPAPVSVSSYSQPEEDYTSYEKTPAYSGYEEEPTPSYNTYSSNDKY